MTAMMARPSDGCPPLARRRPCLSVTRGELQPKASQRIRNAFRAQRAARDLRPLRVLAWQVAILVAVVAAWEYLTGIKAISQTPGLYWIDPFFISRPSQIVERFALPGVAARCG